MKGCWTCICKPPVMLVVQLFSWKTYVYFVLQTKYDNSSSPAVNNGM
uniref:Uncharacterized protein n=1 Tax=Anguilla anguilla TaxID=7936 RepID=A0A0E9UUQ7_ANGAN